jgi:hypothetical protein
MPADVGIGAVHVTRIGSVEYETEVDPAVLEPILKRVIEDYLPKANPELIYLERFQGPSPKLLGALSDVRLRYGTQAERNRATDLCRHVVRAVQLELYAVNGVLIPLVEDITYQFMQPFVFPRHFADQAVAPVGGPAVLSANLDGDYMRQLTRCAFSTTKPVPTIPRLADSSAEKAPCGGLFGVMSARKTPRNRCFGDCRTLVALTCWSLCLIASVWQPQAVHISAEVLQLSAPRGRAHAFDVAFLCTVAHWQEVLSRRRIFVLGPR